MLTTDENLLICDLAETYHILDYKQLPPSRVAVFALGLRENSRIMMKMNGDKVTLENMLLASITDRIGLLVWLNTSDGYKGTNRPKAITDMLIGLPNEKEQMSFTTGEEFEKARQRILNEQDRG